jgi:hypothetical protein
VSRKIFNRVYGFLVGLGIGLFPQLICSKSAEGKLASSTPRQSICWNWNGKHYLVAPRGRTQWVRNAESAGEITLKKGSTRRRFRLRAMPDAEKPPVLKAYLDSFKREVQTLFSRGCGIAPREFSQNWRRATRRLNSWQSDSTFPDRN